MMTVAIQIIDGRSSLYRYDTGVRIRILGCNNITECHFAVTDGVIRREVSADNIVEVPDAALLAPGLLRMYVYDRTATGAITRHSLTLVVNDRPKPADYIDPPDEAESLDLIAQRVAEILGPTSGGGITNETDPTVPAWAKQPQKPEYTAEEVGALDKDSLGTAVNEALAQAKASGEFKGDPGEPGEPGKDGIDGQPGKDGKDGVSVTHEWNGTTLTVTSASGTSSADLKGETGTAGKDGYTPIKGVDYFDGQPGKDGIPGANGTSVTVKSVSESSADGGNNVVTFSDGTTLTVKNGSKGSTGEKGDKGDTGEQGIQGIQGVKGDKGDTGEQGPAGADGAKGDKGDTGEKGPQGDKGDKGDPGHTPERGVDYWTEADQESIVQQVIAALGTPVFGRVDADNNIILMGELANGSYTVKYEDGKGNTVEIGELSFAPVGPVAIPLVWTYGTKINKTDGTIESTTDYNYMATDFVDVDASKTYKFYRETAQGNSISACWYNASDQLVRYDNNFLESNGEIVEAELNPPANATKLKLRVWIDGSTDTVNMIKACRLTTETAAYINWLPISTEL